MNFLLICGGGASSSFVAQNMIKEAKNRGLDFEIEAVGETELEDYIDDRNLILIGPHLKYMEEELSEIINEYDVPYMFIDEKDYAKMDGASILEKAIAFVESK